MKTTEAAVLRTEELRQDNLISVPIFNLMLADINNVSSATITLKCAL